MTNKIFLSYRHDDNYDFIAHVADRFALHFGSDNVFFDNISLRMLENWSHRIQDSIENCDVLIAIIGPHWLDLLEKNLHKNRKSAGIKDYVTHEIHTALKLGKPVAALLVKDVAPPNPGDLPEQIVSILEIQVGRIHPEHFQTDIEIIIRHIEDRLLHTRIDKLDKASPSPGLALSYYLNFVKRIRSKFGTESTEVDFEGGKSYLNDCFLNIMLPDNINTLRDLLQFKEQLNKVTIYDEERPITVSGLRKNGRIHLIDIPTTLFAVNDWLQRRVANLTKQRMDNEWVRLEAEQLEQFVLMLEHWITINDQLYESSANKILLRRVENDMIRTSQSFSDLWIDIK